MRSPLWKISSKVVDFEHCNLLNEQRIVGLALGGREFISNYPNHHYKYVNDTSLILIK